MMKTSLRQKLRFWVQLSGLGCVFVFLPGLIAPVSAHDMSDAAPQHRGFQAGAAVALHYLDSSTRWSANRLGGVLGMGDVPEDQRKGYLEHATLSAGLRLHEQFAGTLALGWHGSDPMHIENAWLEWRNHADAKWSIGFGRGNVPIGKQIETAGHFDLLASMPLVKRTMFNGDWHEDGINVGWQPHLGGWLQMLDRLDVGLWHARRFPGSENASWAPSVHMRLQPSRNLTLDGFYARIKATGRGTYTLHQDMGHTHAAPNCEQSLAQVSCFDGDVNLGSISADWQTPWPTLQLQAAALWRHEYGELYGQASQTNYRGRTRGGWLQAQWQAMPRWNVVLRHEWLQASHHLQGSGATLVANDAGLLPNTPARRDTLGLQWQALRSLKVSVEAGRERVNDRSQSFSAVRLLWQPDALIHQTW